MKWQIYIITAAISVLWTCESGPKKPQKFSPILTRQHITGSSHTFNNVSMANCEDYAVIISASKMAKKLKRSKDWVVSNYQIPIYADTLSKKSRIIGQTLPGGHCFIVEQDGAWFFVQSPGSNQLGWLHRDFVVGFVKKDPETLLPCPGNM